MDWKDMVGKVAPGIATALGGPLAGVAIKFLADALLPPDKAGNAKETDLAKVLAGADPAMLMQLKNLELTFQSHMAELGIDLEKIAAADRASARERQAKTGDRTPQVLAYLYSAGFFSLLTMEIVLALLGVDIPANVLRSLDVATGVLFAFVLATKDYFFGTSASGKDKDALIKHQWDTTP